MNVKLPDGRTITVATNDPAAAAKAGRMFLAREFAQKIESKRSGSGRAFDAGVLMSFNDELDAGMAGAGAGVSHAITGKGPTAGEAYRATKDVVNEAADRFAKEHPVANTAATIGGSLVSPGVGKLAGWAGGAKTLAQAGLRSAGVGALYGGVNGAGSGDGLADRGVKALQGAAVGAPLGFAFPFAGAALANVGRRAGAAISETADAAVRALTGKDVATSLRELSPKAAVRAADRGRQYIADVAAKAKVTPADIRARGAAAKGKPLTAAEAIGPTGISQAAALSRRAGTTPALADAKLTARGAERPERLLGDIAETTGVAPEHARNVNNAVVQMGKDIADPAYEAVRAHTGPVMNPALEDVARRPAVQKALRAVYLDMLNAGQVPEEAGLIGFDQAMQELAAARGAGEAPSLPEVVMAKAPTAQTWLAVKQMLGRQVQRNPLTNEVLPDTVSEHNYGISEATKALTHALGDSLPGYKDALAKAGDYLSVRGAFDRAKGALFSTKTTPADFGAMWEKLGGEAEQGAVRSRLASDIFDAAQNGQLRPGTLRLPAVRAKLETAFGPEAVDDISTRVDIEHAMSQAEGRMRPNLNSVTGDVAQGGAEQDAAMINAVGRAGGHLLSGRPGKASLSLLAPLAAAVRGARTPIEQGARDEAGRLLYMSPEELARVLEGLAPPKRSYPVSVRLAPSLAAAGSRDQ